jgi:hypothetical protein
MPRQPLAPFIERNPGGRFDVGTHAIRQRPDLELLVANCLMAWPPTEAEMALLLAHLLGVDQSVAALAVFHSLRRSSAQRDAISEAARVTLNGADQELLSAIFNAHKSVEGERNALTHGHFGIYSNLQDGIIWMDTKTYVALKASWSFNSNHSRIKSKTRYIQIFMFTKNRTLKEYLRTSRISQISGINLLATCDLPLARNALNYTSNYVTESIFAQSWRNSVVKILHQFSPNRCGQIIA